MKLGAACGTASVFGARVLFVGLVALGAVGQLAIFSA